MDHLKKATEQVVAFIWKNLFCSNIRIEIYHLKDETTGQFKVEVDVKNAFAACGFKWKTLSNDPITGKRAQIMQVNKPTTVGAFENVRRLDIDSEPISVKSGLILAFGKNNETQEHTKVSNIESVSCLLNGLTLFKKCNEMAKTYSENNPDSQLSKYLQIADKLPNDTEFPASRAIITQAKDEATALAQSQGLKVDVQTQADEYLTSMLSLAGRLPPFDYAEYNNHKYLRIKSDSLISVKHVNPSTKKQIGSDIFVVPTDDERLKIIIIPVDAIQDKIHSLAETVQNVFKSCEEADRKCSELWVPSFKVESIARNQTQNLKIQEDVHTVESVEVSEIKLCKGKL